MNTTVAQTFSEEGFSSLISQLDEPGWLTDQRREAWDQFQGMAWPDRQTEEWIRTDIRMFDLARFPLPGENPDVEIPDALLSVGVDLAGSTGAINGCRTHLELESTWRDKGVILGDIGQLAHEHPELIQKYLFKIGDSQNTDRFSALHAACWSSGTILFVPRGVTVDKPIHVRSILTGGGTDMGHLLVILDDGAEATVLYETGSCDESDTGFHCGAIEISVGDRANLRFVDLQSWGSGVWHFAHEKANIGRDASLQWTTGALGSRLSKVNQHVELIGDGANSQVNGVMFTEGKQHLCYNTKQHHVAPSCRSDFLYKAALQDRSRTVWRGMIRVDETAQKTDGYQRNDNLLLSDKARADSIPGLEIEADDVRCTHGSTSGQVDEELIFYAMCRGYTRKEAIRMIVTGFFQQIFDRISIESVRVALGQAIGRRVRDYD